jgi:hypothetical protein
MSNDQPLRGPSVPGDEVDGPIDLVMPMNVATSEDWDQVPLPARQQLGWHERYDAHTGGNELVDYVGKTPQDLLHSPALAGSEPEAALDLVRSVTYHLEATPPPAQPAGAPGSDGYNRFNRNVPPAPDFEHPADFTLEQGANTRTFRLPEGVGLSEEEQAKVDGVGPHSPTQFMAGDLRNVSEDTRERSSQTPSVNDPYRNADGSLKDPEEVQDTAPAYPDSDFGSKDLLEGDEPKLDAAVDTEGTKNVEGNDPADGLDQTVEPVGGDDSEVPDGTVKEVLDWVGDDSARARAALEAEQAKDSPRSSLVGQLNDKV